MTPQAINPKIAPCPHCNGPVVFHQDNTDCPQGCHYLWCATCKALTDLSGAADPANECETLEELRARIIPLWNRRASPTGEAVAYSIRNKDGYVGLHLATHMDSVLMGGLQKAGYEFTPLYTAPRLPEGVVMVPREPTEAMCKAALATPGMQEVEGAISNAWIHGYKLSGKGETPLIQAYKAMIAAAGGEDK